MKRSWRSALWLAVLLGAAPLPRASLPAAEIAPPASPPLIKSPVDFFRELLAMTPEERRKAIANRSPGDQKRVLAKIREYESLKPDRRELQLRVTELHWYLLPLLGASATDRAAQLALIPPDARRLVEDRLQQWDRLKPEVQKELLTNEQAMQLFIQLESSTEMERRAILAGISAARRQQLEAELARIRTMPEDQRRELREHFNQFFDLTPREKERALRTLSETERRQMEKTLRAFAGLPREQRDQCVQSFSRFVNMSLAEQQLFLKNAERWRLMSPEEREAWRDLVRNVPELPPAPPGAENAARSLSPAPPGRALSAATNGGELH